MSKSKIEWTNETWNPVIGCSKVSAGCDNCYAERMAYRIARIAHSQADWELWSDYMSVLQSDYILDEDAWVHKWNGKVVCRRHELEKPVHWRKPRMVFVCSMSDLFHEKVPFEFIGKVFATMLGADQHIYQLLTKRADRMVKFISWFNSQTRLAKGTWKHIWFGVTAENQQCADERIPQLLRIPAAVRYISAEWLLERLDLSLALPPVRDEGGEIYDETDARHYRRIGCVNWVIIGCESMPWGRAGRFQDGFTEAAMDIIQQCDAACVPPFVKQIPIDGRVCRDITKFAKRLQRREWPK